MPIAISPCGTVQDYLRSCYTCLSRLVVGDAPVPIRWFFCPPEAQVPLEGSTYRSLIWDDAARFRADTGRVGEVGGTPRPWTRGEPGAPWGYQRRAGPEPYWIGGPTGPWTPLERNVLGVPLQCGGVGGVLGGVLVAGELVVPGGLEVGGDVTWTYAGGLEVGGDVTWTYAGGLEVGGDVTWTYAGGLEVGGYTVTTGGVEVGGSVAWSGGLLVGGYTVTTGGLLVGGYTVTTGGLLVGGYTVTTGGLLVGGDVTWTYAGGVEVGGTSSGTVWAGGVEVGGTSSGTVWAGGVEVGGSVAWTYAGGLLVGGYTVTTGGLEVGGSVAWTYAGGVEVGGSVAWTYAGGVEVGGSVAWSGGVEVGGVTAVLGGVEVGGDAIPPPGHLTACRGTAVSLTIGYAITVTFGSTDLALSGTVTYDPGTDRWRYDAPGCGSSVLLELSCEGLTPAWRLRVGGGLAIAPGAVLDGPPLVVTFSSVLIVAGTCSATISITFTED